MAANTQPIYTLTPDIQWGNTNITGSNAGMDGTGPFLTGFVAGNNGGYVQRIRFRAAGTNVATVARVFINNGSTNNTASNNILYDEITLSATTASAVAALATYELPLNFALPSGYMLGVTIGTNVATGYFVSVIGGKY